mgnify:CR=1 FL=1
MINLDELLVQARRIAEHRRADAEKDIRKTYKQISKELQHFLSDTYVRLSKDGKLTWDVMQQNNEYARFLEEITQLVDVATPQTQKVVEQLVDDMYKASYQAMMDGVKKASGMPNALNSEFANAKIQPQQIKAAVDNPVSGLTLSDTLEKHRKDIIFEIKRQIGVGLQNGDSYPTMAKRIARSLDGDYRKAVRIVRTEAHRVQEKGNLDAASDVDSALQREQSGMRMAKTWRTRKDERVRPQHRVKTAHGWKTKISGKANHVKMENVTVLQDELFDLGDGVKASAPGQSGSAANDINCRCYLSYALMTDAEFFKKTGRHFTVTSAGKDDIIEPYNGKRLLVNIQLFAEKDIRRQSSASLQRAVRSYQKQIEAHKDKLAHPEQYIDGWEERDPRYKAGLKRHWQKEIRNFQQSIEDRVQELKQRGDYDG